MYDNPLPQRERLHQACIAGDISTVTNIIKCDPKKMEAQDPRGFTPLLLACQFGHVNLVRWLIDRGASLESVTYEMPIGNNFTFRLIDHAGSPAVMELLLHRGINPEDANVTMTEVILRNDVEMAKVMFYYLTHLPMDTGLSVLDLVLRYTGKYGTEMLNVFLSYWDDYVPEGPYDTDLAEYMRGKLGDDVKFFHEHAPFSHNIHPEAVQLLETHQKRIENKRHEEANRPKLVHEEISSQLDRIKSTFCTNDMTIESEILPIAKLSDKEYNDIKTIFFNTFKMAKNDTEDSRNHFLRQAMQDSPKKQVYINLFKHDGKVVSFMAFEVERSFHPDKGEFIQFHGKLAAKNKAKRYESLSLSNLGFRVPLALKAIYPDTPIMVYLTAIPPGYGICILPKFIRFFPKHVLSQSFMQHVTTLAGEELDMKKIPLILALQNSRKPTRTSLALDYFDHSVGADSENAMPVCYEMDARACDEYMQEFSYNAIDSKAIKAFTENWQQLEKTSSLLLIIRKHTNL